ncbi:uncharacterized protein LOC125371712 [Haliotis rufescens]|uniref:uncharacterized protein LOC125371712 n=1 Tax=Haliotis rufescens TaxID=6454 RepID=UPI00201EAAB5|nr:uncharacterized protein LOC125371712 [Haliotis rufescens]
MVSENHDTSHAIHTSAVSIKDKEEPNAVTGVRQKKSDDNLKKKLPEGDTDQKAEEDVADKFAGLALDTDSQSTLQATPPSPDPAPAVSPRDAVPIVPNTLVVNAYSLRTKRKKSILQRRLDGDLKWAHVILVSETWYMTEDTERSITGYKGFFKNRNNDVSGKVKGGGVGIYLSDAGCTDAQVVHSVANEIAEALGVTFMFRGVRWLAVCIYSAPPTNKDQTNWNNNFITLARGEAGGIDLSQTIIAGGDLNHSEVTLPGFTNYVNTRTLRRKSSIIDLLYTNNSRGWNSVKTVEDEETHKQISDHFIVRAFSQDI